MQKRGNKTETEHNVGEPSRAAEAGGMTAPVGQNENSEETRCSVAALLSEDKTEERGTTKFTRTDRSALFLRGAIRQEE